MQNSRRTRFAARCYAYTACSEFLSENRPRFSDATRLDRCRFGMDATSVPCLSRRLEWLWMPSKSASIVLALCGGRLLEFPAAQAAASVTAAWDLRRKFGAMGRRRPDSVCILHEAACVRASRGQSPRSRSGHPGGNPSSASRPKLLINRPAHRYPGILRRIIRRQLHPSRCVKPPETLPRTPRILRLPFRVSNHDGR